MARAYSRDLRERVIENYKAGLPKQTLITTFRIGMDTLNRWIRHYINTGSVSPKQRTTYRPRKFNDTDLIAYIETNPSATLEEIAQHFSVKPPSVHARLKQLGITYKKTFLYEERDEEKRNQFIEKINQNETQPIVYMDECGINNKLRNDYGRALRGVKIIGSTQGHASEKINRVAGLLDHKIIAPLSYSGSTNTRVFNTGLTHCLIPVLPEPCIIVMDNATFHQSEETRRILADHHHTLLFLPPYSPDLNPIENYWAIIKRKVRKVIGHCSDLYSCLECVFQTI